jgi:hypothetical protein
VGRQIDRFVPLRIRAAALMPAAVLTVHQLRFQIAFGSRTDAKLVAEGHQYLGALAPLAAMLVAIAVGLFLASLARAWRGGSGGERQGRAPGFLAVWSLAAVSLLAIYCAQELLEGLLASGHPGGLVGVFGDGGLWAVPLSVLLGGVVALGLRVADVAIRWIARRHVRSVVGAWRPGAIRLPTAVFLILRGPLAGAAAGRAPPLAAATIF